MKKHYILYSHDGSENHGCEALVRSTCMLLNNENTSITLSSTSPEQDLKYGINRICDVHGIHEKISVSKYSFDYLKAAYAHRVKKNSFPKKSLSECRAYDARKGDIALSIGGDSYCYGEEKDMAYRNRIWRQWGIKTVYWGCSIEPELLENEDVVKDIATFDLITARETISYNALKAINPNTILVSDSAFMLNSVELPLPTSFNPQNYIGINISPLVIGCERIRGIVYRNYERLIEYILNETDLNILLIPHVIWKDNDDRVVNHDIFTRFCASNRIAEVSDCNCEELKGFISRCKFFIGARTHSTIAAYSTNVPTLVMGYSIKSIGIARDIFGTDENYVISVQSLTDEDALIKKFKWMVKNEILIRNKLSNVMTDYKARVYKGIDALRNL